MIVFRAYATMDLYADTNAYFYSNPNDIVPSTLKRPMGRNYLGALR